MEEFSDNQAAEETLLQLSTEDATSFSTLIGALKGILAKAYADDVCAIITSSKISTLESLANKLVFDKSKTEAILFSRKHQLPTVKLKDDGIEIPVKNKIHSVANVTFKKEYVRKEEKEKLNIYGMLISTVNSLSTHKNVHEKRFGVHATKMKCLKSEPRM
ncbi:hypothetical protein QYM36_015174 [Artemia franciscana]|uniref:Uncharacterized protein n=1 Tax=Artemia franciscana TaxID=6661 RepID=A0AA88HBM9_ARTSF|nr:hypothetical protein QYM36_015174 [Artemia franciscana]